MSEAEDPRRQGPGRRGRRRGPPRTARPAPVGVVFSSSSTAGPPTGGGGPQPRPAPGAEELALDAVKTLLELERGCDGSIPVSAADLRAYPQVLGAASRFGVPPPDLDTPTAVREMGVGLDYRDEPSGFAPLDVERLSLRPSGASPVALSVLLGPGGQEEVQRFTQECVLDESVASAMMHETGLRVPFFGPRLEEIAPETCASESATSRCRDGRLRAG